jgi:hypothetical protein
MRVKLVKKVTLLPPLNFYLLLLGFTDLATLLRIDKFKIEKYPTLRKHF